MEILISDESCRVCLLNDTETSSIFDIYEESSISEIIMEWTGVKIDVDDSLSKLICSHCRSKVIELMEFRQLCIDSDETIRYNLMLVENSEVSVEEYIMQEDDENSETFEETAETLASSQLVEEEEDDAYEVIMEESAQLTTSTKTKTISSSTVEDDVQTMKMKVAHQAKERKKKHKCPHCEKFFLYPSKVFRHVSAVHKDLTKEKKSVDKKHACNVCGKLFVSQFKVRRHMIVHETEVKIGLQKNWSKGYIMCVDCNRKFYTKSSFERHQLICDLLISSSIVRPKNYKYLCIVCSEEFDAHDTMVDHMKSHLESEVFVCQLCEDFSSQTIQEIIKHGRYHDENITHQCSVCDKLFPNGEEIASHLLRHKDYRPFECDECGKAFFDKYKLKMHKNTHKSDAPKSFTCDHCEKDFAALDYLNCHIRRMHSTKKPFVCEFCFKKFAFLYDLNVHITQHTGELKLVSCLFLNYVLSTNIFSVGDKKHSCNLCEASFTRGGALKKHLSTQHADCSTSTSNKTTFESHRTAQDDEDSAKTDEMIKSADPNLSSFEALGDDASAQDYDLVEVQTF